MHKSCTGNRSNKIIVGGGPTRPLDAPWFLVHGPIAALSLYHDLVGPMVALEITSDLAS